MEVVNIRQAKTNLSALIQKVLNGDKIIIARNNQPVAEIIPLKKEKEKRISGTLRGK
jgi:prevent-host-death family protein